MLLPIATELAGHIRVGTTTCLPQSVKTAPKKNKANLRARTAVAWSCRPASGHEPHVAVSTESVARPKGRGTVCVKYTVAFTALGQKKKKEKKCLIKVFTLITR